MQIFRLGQTKKNGGFILLRSLLVSTAVLLVACGVLLVFAQTMRSGVVLLKKAQDFVLAKNAEITHRIIKN